MVEPPGSIRDRIYVDGHAAAYMLAIEEDVSGGEAYNVGGGVGFLIGSRRRMWRG
jgi:nucleoside-diphosphate-sugar epimerase